MMMMMLPQNLTRVLIILVLVCQTFFIFFQSLYLYGAPAPSFNPQHQELSPQTASDGVPNFHSIAIYSKANETQPIPQQQSYSQAKQDMIILHLTDANDAKQKEKNHTTHHADSSRQKFFVDLASNDAVILSNTLLLERNNWRGLCIEPNPIYWYRLASYRTCSIIGAMVGGERENDGTEVDVKLSNGVLGGIVGEGMDNAGGGEEKRNIVSISTVFEKYHAPEIMDYLSLDVEGAESYVMKNFDWDRYKFKFLTVERPKDDLKHLFKENGYHQVRKITNWGETLWIHQELVSLTIEDIDAIFKEHGLCDIFQEWLSSTECG